MARRAWAKVFLAWAGTLSQMISSKWKSSKLDANAKQWSDSEVLILFYCTANVAWIPTVLHRHQGKDVSKHLPSDSLMIWTSSQGLQMLFLILPQIPPGAVHPISLSSWHPAAHQCSGSGITSSSNMTASLPGACTCSAPTAAKFPCTNAHDLDFLTTPSTRVRCLP